MAIGAATTPAPNGLPYPAAQQEPTQVLADSGAITIPAGQVWLTKAGVSTVTLADPPYTSNGLRLTVTSRTAQAHVLDLVTGVDGGAADEGTFGGAAYDHVVLESQNGVWCIVSKLNVTFA